MLIRNIAAILTGQGFAERDGRCVRAQDSGFVAGPIDIAIDDATGLVTGIGQDLEGSGRQFDATDMFALPGFIDPHTHPIFGGDRSNEYFMRWAGKSYLEITEAGGGIHSTVRATSAASDAELAADLRARLAAMRLAGATVVEAKSGYADSAVGELRLLRIIKSLSSERGLPEIRPSFLALHALPRGRTEREYVDELIAALPTVINEQLASQVDSFPENGFFTLESALRFSEAAKKVGLPAKVHADELSDLGSSEVFAQFGTLSVDHLQHISDAAVRSLGTLPTVATMLPSTSLFVGIPYANARRLIDAGARVALASDFNPGTAPAGDLQLTHMLAASQMRMSAAEILCATSFNAAAALGMEKSHGVLAEGRAGNVLLFEALPGSIGSQEGAMRSWQEIILSRRSPARVFVRGEET